MTEDRSAFECYDIIGDYYDCDGNLVEQNAVYESRCVVRETGTVFDGGIGLNQYNECRADQTCTPATDCRVYYDMSPRKIGTCSTWPAVPSPPDKNAGRPPVKISNEVRKEVSKDSCETNVTNIHVKNPVNVATGNKYEEVLDLTVSTPGIPLEFGRSYNSQVISDGPLGYGWAHTYDLSIQVVQETAPKRVIIWDSDGKALYFSEIRRTTEILFSGESGVKDRLKQIISTGEYFLRRKEGNRTYQIA